MFRKKEYQRKTHTPQKCEDFGVPLCATTFQGLPKNSPTRSFERKTCDDLQENAKQLSEALSHSREASRDRNLLFQEQQYIIHILIL